MIPDPWSFVLLSLAVYRVVRFLGWDDWPPIARARGWALGERWVELTPADFAMPSMYLDPPTYFATETPSSGVELPGKTPSSEVDDVRPAYDRPTLAHLVHCPFCLGAWISLATWLVWLAWPHATLGLAFVPALSGAVGLLAKNLDP